MKGQGGDGVYSSTIECAVVNPDTTKVMLMSTGPAGGTSTEWAQWLIKEAQQEDKADALEELTQNLVNNVATESFKRAGE